VRLSAVSTAGAVRPHQPAPVTVLMLKPGMLRPGHPAAAACHRLPHEAPGRAAGIATEGAETSLLRCQRSRQASSYARRTPVAEMLTACSPAVLTACRRLKERARCCCNERPVARVQNPLLARATVNAAPLPQVCVCVRTPLPCSSCMFGGLRAAQRTCVTRGLPQARTKQPARPGKVPLEKGYSQMDWLRLTRTHPDLAGTRREDSDPVCLPCSSCRPGTSPRDSVLLLGANAAQPGACLAARRGSGCCAGGQAWGAGRCGGTSRWRRSRGTTRRRTRGLRCAARCGAARRGPDPMTGPGERSSSVYCSCESCERRCAATQCS